MIFPIPIMFYVPLLAVGGTEKRVLDLACGLDKNKFVPSVWFSGAWGPIGNALLASGIQVWHRELCVDRASATAAWLRDMHPRIFHSFSYRLDAADVLAATLAEIPVIITSRGNLRHWDQKGSVQPWERIRNLATHQVIACCKAVAEVVGRIERVPAAKLRVIYTGVTMSRDNFGAATLRRQLNVSPGAFVVGSIANFRALKGHVTLVRAFKHLVQHGIDAYLLLCGVDGDGSKEMSEVVRRETLQERVIVLREATDLVSVYSTLDVYVQASTSEGLSRSLLEAMSAGVPIVATDVGGTSEAIVNGVHGILVQPGRADEMAQAVAALARDAALRKRLGAAAAKRATRRCDLPDMVRRHQELYRSLLFKACTGGCHGT